MPMVSNRFLMVPVDSSAARMPRPGATIASATLCNSTRFIALSSMFGACGRHYASSAARRGSGKCFQHLHARQRLALQKFEERAAGGGDVGEAVFDRRPVQRRHRVAAAGEAGKLAGGGQ